MLNFLHFHIFVVVSCPELEVHREGEVEGGLRRGEVVTPGKIKETSCPEDAWKTILTHI